MARKMSIVLGGARSPPAQSDERNNMYLFPGGSEVLVFVMLSRFALGDDRWHYIMIGIDSKLGSTKRTLCGIILFKLNTSRAPSIDSTCFLHT